MDDLFQSDICVVDGSCYEDRDVNPVNASQVCRVTSPSVWTIVTGRNILHELICSNLV